MPVDAEKRRTLVAAAVQLADHSSSPVEESCLRGSPERGALLRREHLPWAQRALAHEARDIALPGQQLYWKRLADLQLHAAPRCSHAWIHTRQLHQCLLGVPVCWTVWASEHPRGKAVPDLLRGVLPCAFGC